jgi:hypothetical protein
MAPKIMSQTKTPTGSGPGGRIEISDIRAKLQEIRGDTDEKVEAAMPYAVVGGVAGLVVLIILVFLLGRARGKRKATWVEIRRL